MKTFPAKYRTTCGSCGSDIEIGAPIHKSLNGWVHLRCPKPTGQGTNDLGWGRPAEPSVVEHESVARSRRTQGRPERVRG